MFGADLRPCQRVGTFECLRFGRFKKFNVFKRFNACLSQGIDEFGRFGRFGLVGLRGLMPAYRRGLTSLVGLGGLVW